MESNPQITEGLRIASDLFEDGRYEDAAKNYRLLAEQGAVGAQLRLGWMYHAGKGVQKNLDEAEKWYLKAAITDSPEAQFYLATLYRSKEQYKQAIEWLQKSALQNYAPATYLLGKLYYMGEGVDQNRGTAFKYFEQAAKNGHLFALRNIAYDIIKGRRGISRIPFGVFLMVKVLWAAIKISLKDPDSDMIRRH